MNKTYMPFIFIAGFFLFFPVHLLHLFMPISHSIYLNAFTMPLMGVLTAGLLLSGRRWVMFKDCAPVLQVSFALFTAVALWHFFRYSGMNAEYFFYSLLLLTAPLLVCFYAEEFLRLLPWAMTLFWLMLMGQTGRDWWHGEVLRGLPRNHNWNASATLVCSLFVAWMLWKLWSGRGSWLKLSISVSPVLLSMVVSYLCSSKGTLVAIAILAALVLFVELCRHRFIRMAYGIGIVATLVLGYIFSGFVYDNYLALDVRVPIWEASMALIRDHFLLGTSHAGFESVFAPYVGEDYYMKQFMASRNNHPHNHYLYVCATMGIVCALLWMFLSIYPLVLAFINFKKLSGPRRIVAAACLLLLLHGMVDVVLFEWPNSMLFLIFLGILWHDAFLKKDAQWKNADFHTATRITVKCAGVLLLLFTAYELYRNARYALYFREASYLFDRGDGEAAAVLFDRAVAVKYHPQGLYRAANAAFYRLKNPEITLRHLTSYDQELNANYSCNNGLAGQCYLIKEMPGRAIPYLERETRNFPLNATSHFLLSLAYDKCGRKEEGKKALERAGYCLGRKSMDFRHLPFLLQNPYYDLRWRDIPPGTFPGH